MAELEAILSGNIIDAKRHIHDAVDVGADMALSAGVEVGYPCEYDAFEYLSNGRLWDPATSELSGGILDQVILMKWSFTLNSANNNSTCLIRIVIPDPGGEIEVFSNTYSLPALNTDYRFSNTTMAYNGPEVVANGLKVYITPGSNSTIKARAMNVAIL